MSEVQVSEDAIPAAAQPQQADAVRAVLDDDGLLDTDRLRSVEAELVGRGAFQELAQLYAGAAERAAEPAVGRQMFLSAGLVWLERLKDPARARIYLSRVLASDPGNPDALGGLWMAARAEGRHAEAADLGEALVEVLPEPERVPVLAALAEVAQGPLGQTERALSALRYAYELDPARWDVLEQARALFEAQGRFADAQQVLDDETRTLLGEAVDRGADALAARAQEALDAAQAHTDDPAAQEAVTAVRRLAEAYRRLGEALLTSATHHDLAELCLTRARALGDQEALSRLDELAHLRTGWEAKATGLRDAGFEAPQKRRAAELYLQAAELYARYGQDALRADEYLDRCLLLSPGFPPALRYLDALHRTQGREGGLLKRLNAMAASVKDPRVKADILLRVAQLLEGMVPEDGPPDAEAVEGIVNAYRRLLALEPGHREAVARLVEILAGEGRAADLAQVLEGHLAALTDPYDRTQVHLNLGRVYAEQLGDSARARNHFEAVLALQPTHFLAASALRALYKDAREAPLLLGVQKVLLDHCPDLFSRLDLLTEMAEVAEEVSKDEAFAVRRLAFELDPTAAEARERLETLAGELSRYRALADTFAAAAARRTGAQAEALWIAAGRLYDGKLPRPQDALRAFREALRLDPDNTEAHAALERLLREQDDPAALVEMFRAQLTRTEDPEQALILRAKIGDVMARELGDWPGAIEMMEGVLAQDPDNASALASLDDLYKKTERWADLAKVLDRRAQGADGEGERADLTCRRARVLEERLERAEEAADLYLDVLNHFPDHPAPAPALAALLERGVAQVRIAEALEPVYGRRGQPARQVEMLAVRMEHALGEARAKLAERAAEIARTRLEDPQAALRLSWVAVAARPGDEALLASTLELARAHGGVEAAAETLGRVLDTQTLEAEVRSRVASALAELLERDLGRPADAIARFRQALDADGSNASAIAALTRLLGAEARYPELAALLKDRIAATDDRAARVQLGLSLAGLLDEHLGDTDGAIEALRAVLSVAREEPSALSRLAELYARSDRHRELVGVLDRIRDASGDPEVKAQSEVRAGEVAHRGLSDPAEALARFERALAHSPAHPGAVRGLERLLDEDAHRVRAGALLAPCYEAAERWPDLVLALESQLAGHMDRAERSALFERIAAVEAEKLDLPVGAFETLSRAFREGLLTESQAEHMAALAQQAGRAKDLARLYEDALGAGSNQPELPRALARLYDGAAADPAKARAAWNRVLEAAPGDGEALEALERLTAAGDNPGALGQVLEKRAEAAATDAERVAFLKRAAAIYEEAAEDLPAAIRVMESARALDPDDRGALAELARYYAEHGDTAKLEEVLGAQAERLEEPLSVANVLVRRAEVKKGRGELAGAIQDFSAALGKAPDHAAARQGLEKLLSSDAAPKAALALEPVYRAAGDWGRLVDAYEILVATSEEPQERVERLVAIRSIYEERLGQLDRAFQAAARAWREAPTREDLLSGLERLGKLSGSVEELIGVLEDQAEALPYVSEERAALRLRVARYAETLLQDRARAVDAYRRAVEERPDALAALEALERLHAKAGEHRELVDVLKKMAGVLEQADLRADRLRLAGRILEEQLGDRAQAAHLYEQVIMVQPGDPEALKRLDALYAQARAHEDLARVLRQRVAYSEREEQAGLRLRLGQIELSARSNPRGALEAYAGILADGAATAGEGAFDGALYALDDLMESIKGQNPEIAGEAARILEPHFLAKEQIAKVVSTKEVQVATAQDPDARKGILQQIARHYAEDLGQPEMAFLSLTRAYSEHPADRGLVESLEALADRADTHEELAELFGQALPSIDERALALHLARTTAQIYDARLSRGDLAVPYYNWVLNLEPEDLSSLKALERIHTKRQDMGALADVYRGMLRVAPDEAARKDLHGRIAEILDSELSDSDGAFAAYRAMLEVDPEDRSVLKRMAALCERSGRLEDLAQVLAKDVELAGSTDEQAQVLLRLATLQRERLDDPEAAVESYARVLELRKGDPGAIAGLAAILRSAGQGRAAAAAVLAPVYRGNGAFPEYVECLQLQVEHSRDAAARRDLLVEIAETYESRLGRPEHAFTYAQRALHEDPGNGGVRARLERLAGENELMEELAAYYLDEVEGVTDHDLALMLRRRVAEIYDGELKDVPRAIAEYGKVLDVSPGDSDALKALERLYREAGSFGALADVYRRRIAQTDDVVARAKLLREFSRLQARELGDAPGAIASLRRLLELEPNDLEALQRLAGLCKQQGRASELSDVLTQLIETADEASPARLDAMLELSRLKLEKLGDVAGAEALLAEILERDPGHEATKELLQERFEDAVAEEDAHRAEAMGDLLATALRKTEQWRPLISVLRMRAEVVTSPLARVPLDREVAEIFEQHLGQPELAFSTLSRVYADAPGLEDVRSNLDRLAEELLMWDELVEVLQAGLPNAHDSELAQNIQRRIAQVLDQKMADKERGAEAWQRVLSSAPMDPEGLAALDRLSESLGRWAAVADVLEKRIQLAEDGDERHELCRRLGAVWDERLSEPAEAIDWYRRARAERPRDRETLLALARLLDPETHAKELFAVLEALEEGASDDRERLRHKLRMAQIAQEGLRQPGQAIDLYRQVLTLDDDNPKALEGLEALYEHEGRWADLAALLERQVERARDEKELVRLQRRLGLVKGTRLGSVDEAVRSWSEILKRNPNDVEALQALRQIYREAGRYEELVQTLRKLIPLQLDAEGVKGIRFELAEVFLSHLNQREEAIESAKRVLDVEPHTGAELMALEELFVKCGAYGEAVRVMNHRAEQADNKADKIEILFEIARIYEERVGRLIGAATAYEQILELSPTSTKAYEALAAIYEKNGDYRKLVELYNRRLDVTEEAQARKKLLYAIIDVQERWLGHPELAFTAACRAFAEEGADAEAQALAERLADETDNWEILAEVYEEQVDQVGVARAVELRRRLGEIYLDELDDADQAEHQFELVLSMRVEDDLARERLISLYSSQDRWGELIAQLTDKVDLSTDLEEKKLLYRRMAEIEETRLGDVEAAISSTKRVLDLDPDDRRALMELARIFRAHEKWHPLLNALQRLLEKSDDPEEQKKLRMDVAQVWEQGIEDTAQAIEHYKDVLVLDEGYLPALKALERLYTGDERWIELVDVYERQVGLTQDAEEAIRLLTRVANIWEDQFRDLDGAAKTLIRVLEVDPEHLPTVKSLERIWREAEDWEHLIEAKERHIELTADPQEQVGLYLEIGDILLRQLGRVDAAEAAYGEALALDPASKDGVHALGALHERHGNWFNALDMLGREAKLLGARPEAVEIHYRMGKINEEMLMDRDAAMDAYTRALDIDPGYAPAVRALRKMHEEDGRWGEVVSLLAQEAQYSGDSEDKAELFTRTADLSLEQFDDEEAAIRYFDRALEADPQHTPALRTQADLLFAREEWEKAERLLTGLVDRLDRAADQEELCRQYYRLAYIAEKLGDDRQALKRYLASYELDATYLPTLEGLGAALLRSQRWEDAQRVFQTILIQHRTSLTDAEVVDLHWQIGELAAKLDQLDRAKKSFSKALDLDPDHGPTLMASAHLAERQEDWEEAYDHRERLIGLLAGEPRFEALVEQARLCEEKIQEPYRAIDAYQEARRERPDDEAVLRALGRLFDQTGQVPQTIEVLNDLGQVLEDPRARRDVFTQLADVHYQQEKNPVAAVVALNNALDLDPMHIAAFQKIEGILYETRNWPALEENYHRMIKRLPLEQQKARLVLWRSLGDLYSKVLKNEDGARVAYEVVLNKLDPDANDVAEQLAELYAKKRETAPKAVVLYHRLLGKVEDPALPARRLFELYHALGQVDRAFCALGSLVLMRAATADEVKVYSLLLKKAPQWPTGGLTENLWRTQVLHPSCRNALADILSVLYRGGPALFEEAQRGLKLSKKERVDLAAKGRNARVRLRYFDVWQRLHAAMNVGDMEHFHRPGMGQAPRMYPGGTPVLFAGEQHDVFKTMPPRLLAWTVARQMACARPELAPIRALMAPDEVGAAIEAAIQLFLPEGSGVDLNLDPRRVQAWSQDIRRVLSPQALKALRDPVAVAIQKRDMKRMRRFLEGCEHTASRAALLMAGDVAAAERGLGDADLLVDVSFRARVRELMLFTLSEDHFQLREKLGLAIRA